MSRERWLSVFTLVVALAGVTAATAHAQTSDNPAFRASESSLASAQGKQVRVTTIDGSTRTARLTSFSASEVELQEDGRTVSMGLNAVRKIERTSHYVRWGLLLGTLAGYGVGSAMVSACNDRGGDDCGWGTYIGLGLGAGIGAAGGAFMNVAARDRHLLYLSPGSRSVSIVPAVSPRSQGAALLVRW